MLCINTRLYRAIRPHWTERANRGYRAIRPHWTERANRGYRSDRAIWIHWSTRSRCHYCRWKCYFWGAWQQCRCHQLWNAGKCRI